MATKPVVTPPDTGWVEITIYNTGTSPVPLAFGNVDSLGDAGGIYLKNGILTITDIAITTAKAGGKGGFIYADD
jgi:hypothetical protein